MSFDDDVRDKPRPLDPRARLLDLVAELDDADRAVLLAIAERFASHRPPQLPVPLAVRARRWGQR